MEKIKIGISSCLLGNEVRFDGQHKHDKFITGTLGHWCDFLAVCAEVECGLSIPREALRLVGSADKNKIMTNKNFVDITGQMQDWVKKRLEELDEEDLVAFIFKAKSPSCGMRSIKVYKEDGNIASYKGRGLFAEMFIKRFPLIPVEDEGRLHDPGIRENFIEKIFILQRWKETVRESSASALIDFHSRHKYTLMAHSPVKLRALGKLTAVAGSSDIEKLKDEYLEILLSALDDKKTVSKNTNVLQHIMGYFKKILDTDEKAELLEVIQKYQSGFVPIIVPLTLLNHYVRKYDQPYLEQQWYLNPHPFEIGLLNHV